MAKLPVVARRFAHCPFPLFYCWRAIISWSHPFLPCSAIRKPNESMRLIVVTIVGVVFGFFVGISFPTVSITKVWAWSIHTWYWGNSTSVIWLTAIFRTKTYCYLKMLQLHFPSSIVSYIEDKNSGLSAQAILNHAWTAARNARGKGSDPNSNNNLKVWACALYEFLSITCLFFFSFKTCIALVYMIPLLWQYYWGLYLVFWWEILAHLVCQI